MDKETEKMFEILHENKERILTKELIEKQLKDDRERLNKEKKARRIKTVIVGILLILVTIVLLILMYNSDKDFINKCVSSGLSEYTCQKAA